MLCYIIVHQTIIKKNDSTNLYFTDLLQLHTPG